MSGVVGALPLSGGAERLAGIPASNEVNASSKQSCREGFKVRPNRSGSQGTLFHLRDQVGNGEGFDLHISGNPVGYACEVNSSFDATISGAKREYSG